MQCEYCGKEIKPGMKKVSGGWFTTYCSKKCFNADKGVKNESGQRTNDVGERVKCYWCGTQMKKNDAAQYGYKHFCGRKCLTEACRATPGLAERIERETDEIKEHAEEHARKSKTTKIIWWTIAAVFLLFVICETCKPKSTQGTNTRSNIEKRPATNANSFSVKYVNAPDGNLNLRRGPSANTEILTVLTQGTAVNVYSAGGTGNWVRVRYGNHEGFVNQRFLSDTQPATSTGGGNAGNTRNLETGRHAENARKAEEDARRNIPNDAPSVDESIRYESTATSANKLSREERRQMRQEQREAKREARR